LPVGSRERDVVYTLALELLHGAHFELDTGQALVLASWRRQATLGVIPDEDST
jgi:hypothetical protein